jgi:hypothetical protein
VTENSRTLNFDSRDAMTSGLKRRDIFKLAAAKVRPRP